MDNDNKYLPELMAEKDSIDSSYVHAVRLIKQEIERLKNPPKPEALKPADISKILLDVTSGKMSKVECDIRVPAEDYPNVNFVGRLIGPGGSTMKGIQELTNTRMAVLGKGSVREKDKKKIEEAKAQGKEDKYAHLKYPLHVHISALGPVPQAYVNLGRACAEIQKVLQIDEDTEAQFAAAQGIPPGAMGRGGMRGGMSSPGFRGRGGPGGGSRGVGGRGGQRGRGGFQSRGGTTSSRGGGATSGGGMGGSQRGSGRGGRGSGRGGQNQQSQYGTIKSANDSFTEDYGYDTYGGATGATAAMAGAYDTSGYGMEGYEESYDASYDASYGAEAAAYGEGAYGESYDEYGYGAESYDAYGNGASGTAKATGYGTQQNSFRGKIGGRGGTRGRQRPY